MKLKSTLEQWQALQEIDNAGSIQTAAKSLNKSHSTLIYLVKKLESQLGVELLQVNGRRATPTKHGKSLLRKADSLLQHAKDLESMGGQLSAGTESEITIAIDHLCDARLLYQAVRKFLKINHTTSLKIIETSLSKTTTMVTNQEADIAIVTFPITNYPTLALSQAIMLPVVSIDHPLASRDNLSISDLSSVPQIVIRDLGTMQSENKSKNAGWLKASQRITVDNFDHAFTAIEKGLGFGRIPEHILRRRGKTKIKILKVNYSEKYMVPLHITLPKGGSTGPAAKHLYELLAAKANI